MRLRGAVLLLMCVAATVAAQPRRAPAASPPMMAEAVAFAPDPAGPGRVDILIRTGTSFFVAVRNTDASFPHAFRRRGEILVELLDSTGVSRARDMRRIDLGDDTAERPAETQRWYQSVFSLRVPPGTYTLFLEVDDLESRRTVTDRSRRVTVPAAQPDSLLLGATLFLNDTLGTVLPDTVRPHNYGGTLLFGAATTLLLEVEGPGVTTGPVSVVYRLRLAGDGKESQDPVVADSIPDAGAGTGYVLRAMTGNGDAAYTIARDTNRATAFLVIPIPTHTLHLRNFHLELTVQAGTQKRSAGFPVRVIWPDMPRSLRDVDYALDALRYTTTERELDSLKSGGFEQRRANLEGYWALRDNTPGTAFNEVMTQYYRRVDYASRTFATLRQPDGFRTDRGRIFVLYGPPSRQERTLDPQTGYRETWVYDNLQRRFVFSDRTKTGDYELIHAADQ